MFFSEKIISKLLKLPTPFYYYDVDIFEMTIKKVIEASKNINGKIHYALKANHQNRLLGIVAKSGLGADCVSGGEIQKALENGISAESIVFAGVGKTDAEIEYAIKNKVFCLNVESIEELMVIDSIAQKMNDKVSIALRINPNVDAYTHKFITTGLEENKFGINASDLKDALEKLSNLKNVELIGIHFHIGSQITDLSVFKNLCLKINEILRFLEERRIEVNHINVGGGLGINYMYPDEHLFPDFEGYFNVFEKFLERRPNQQLHFELGRALVAQCGALICKVIFHKTSGKKHFLILDSGMNHLIRPALYEAYHKMENISKYNELNVMLYDVCGPICETTDYFGKNVLLPETQRGDYIAVRSAGAYGEVMASNYNLRGYPSVYFSDEI
ncbi:MAG: diaminopimelate decarboxylase [Bacteroidia bacterium]|nr:MAG: diaminopimelate decarboxylase [Bacteroidia bacterium]